MLKEIGGFIENKKLMEPLIDILFRDSESLLVQDLYSDSDCRLLVEQQIGKKLLASDEVIVGSSLEQVMVMTSLSPFASSENECCEVAHIVYWAVDKPNIIPFVTEYSGKELAYRCLVSLGLFKKYMRERHERKSAPPVSFYRQVGQTTFKQMGMDDIGEHFCKWENFLNEMFCVG